MNNKFLSNIENIITDAKNGKIFILVDDENRENEGDLVIMAEKCKAEDINFMAKYGRGLICLSLSEERINDLGLPLMSSRNNENFTTAFTSSIDAKYDITTGISASDRAKTIQVAIDANKGKNDIVTPGHIFPLQARKGGVLVRAGHTEASVDIAKIASMNESAVICEIMNDDGSMARKKDLIKFAQKFNLSMINIVDIIKYRHMNEKIIKRVSESFIDTQFAGRFKIITYYNLIDKNHHIVLIKNEIKKDINLVRFHNINIYDDLFMSNKNQDKNNLLHKSMKIIDENNNGIIVIIKSHNDLSKKDIHKMNLDEEIKNYGIGSQILSDLSVKDMILLTNSKKNISYIKGYDINIVKYMNIYDI